MVTTNKRLSANALSQHRRMPSDFAEGDSYESRPYDRFDDWQFKTAFIDFIGEFETAGIQHQLLIGANSLDYYYGQLRTVCLITLLFSRAK